ncbi:MAG: nucleotidyl transferase AbiEii/AbiGii toxin family protein [Candidatus Omnitrophica bacterium]|nr:nucleotidyl transferase AbiEii/AbiGii toxin family protein [Candidatus Omnitrophota bacterium]
MSISIIQQRLNFYQCRSAQEEEHALREITQEVALAALSRTGFFKHAVFHGGTSLRILYGLNRFSEDLDFMLRASNLKFNLDMYLREMVHEFEAYGYSIEIVDRSKAENPIKKAFLKDDSLGKVLQLGHMLADRSTRKIRVKVEVDSNPPSGSGYENKFLDFPYVFSLTVQNQESLFAGKIHALLCREYVKGRDWYDFIWYAGRGTLINFHFLAQALKQNGPWKGKQIKIDLDWCADELTKKIEQLDWSNAKRDVERFIKIRELPSVELWGKELFLNRLKNYVSAEGANTPGRRRQKEG